jgi:hypothetical protein
MELKTFIDLRNLAAYLRGVAVCADEVEGEIMNQAADDIDKITANELPFELRSA